MSEDNKKSSEINIKIWLHLGNRLIDALNMYKDAMLDSPNHFDFIDNIVDSIMADCEVHKDEDITDEYIRSLAKSWYKRENIN